jgi:hypothetical protein
MLSLQMGHKRRENEMIEKYSPGQTRGRNPLRSIKGMLNFDANLEKEIVSALISTTFQRGVPTLLFLIYFYYTRCSILTHLFPHSPSYFLLSPLIITLVVYSDGGLVRKWALGCYLSYLFRSSQVFNLSFIPFFHNSLPLFLVSLSLHLFPSASVAGSVGICENYESSLSTALVCSPFVSSQVIKA